MELKVSLRQKLCSVEVDSERNAFLNESQNNQRMKIGFFVLFTSDFISVVAVNDKSGCVSRVGACFRSTWTVLVCVIFSAEPSEVSIFVNVLVVSRHSGQIGSD